MVLECPSCKSPVGEESCCGCMREVAQYECSRCHKMMDNPKWKHYVAPTPKVDEEKAEEVNPEIMMPFTQTETEQPLPELNPESE